MTDLKENLRVPIEELTRNVLLDGIMHEHTGDITPQQEIIGQERAIKAMRLGLGMKSFGYNIFVSGVNGTGRRAAIERLLEEFNVSGPIPEDLCYANNFKNPDQPMLLMLGAGHGRVLKQQMKDFSDSIKKKIPAIFESEEFQAARNEIVNRRMGRQRALFKNLENLVSRENFMMVQVQVGPFTKPDLAPVVVGNPMKIEQLEALVEEGKYSAEELEKIKAKHQELVLEMEKTFKEARQIEKIIQEDLEQLAKQWVEPLVQDMVAPILEAHSNDLLKTYLEEVEADIVGHLDRFRPRVVPSGVDAQGQPGPPMLLPPDPGELKEYEINVLVDNSETKKPPVVVETTPTFRNLFGTIERVMDRTGMWSSDYRHVKAGSFLKARGGYLVLYARDALLEVGVWAALERSLRNRMVEVQTDPFSFLFTSALKPEKIPSDVKVIMIGEPELYELLHWYDEDFRKIFKVKADFDHSMPNTDENIRKLVGFIARIAKDEDLLPFDKSAVQEVSRLAMRAAGRKKRVSTQFERMADLLREADLHARQAACAVVSASHVEQAHKDRIERVSLVEEKIHEYIEDDIIMIDTDGKKIGQINGLSVYSFPEVAFGKPSKITATTSMGKTGIINIEREADLSGNTYNKGMLILAGFLRSRFAQDKPLNLTASICFEQSYSGVDGDSASSTELYALMSSLSGAPIDQGIAVTGSVNQFGEIQPIGGVNEKIEGFFKVCKSRGLTGSQGVMIPRRNIGDLMLDSEVREACEQARFHIWAVDHVDQGIEILTGTAAGVLDDKEDYPENSINLLVSQRLEDLSEAMKEFESGPQDSQGPEGVEGPPGGDTGEPGGEDPPA
ncbi:MAG: ATP-binding protein [Thermodesulfobacteriota bacterium]